MNGINKAIYFFLLIVLCIALAFGGLAFLGPIGFIFGALVSFFICRQVVNNTKSETENSDKLPDIYYPEAAWGIEKKSSDRALERPQIKETESLEKFAPFDYLKNFPENFDCYKEYTKASDWESICHANGVAFDKFGTKKELKFLSDYLEKEEVVFALASGVMTQTETSNLIDFGTNTWLVILTNERFLFMDAAMLTDSVDTQSIRLNRVQAVSASQGIVLGKIMIDLGSRVVTVDNCMKESVKVVADVANKWIRVLEREEKENSSFDEKKGSSTSSLDDLKNLAELHASGILTDEEFAEAKSKILDRI